MTDELPVNSREPGSGNHEARDVGGNWKRLGSVNWANIFRMARRNKLRRYMIDEDASPKAIRTVLGKRIGQQGMAGEGEEK